MKNLITLFEREVQQVPDKKAVIFFDKNKQIYSSITFSNLLNQVNNCAEELLKLGIEKGMRAIIGIPPSLIFIIYTLALFKLAAVPVFIDGGMKKKKIIQCIKDIKPQILVGNSFFQFIGRFICKGKNKIRINTDKIILDKKQNLALPTVQVDLKDLAAIIFTSGSTGSVKGVEYTHKIFCKQIQIIKEIYNISHEDRDLSIFPLFSLLAVCMGMGSVIPNVNMSYPAKISCAKIFNLFESQKVTFSFGSPTFWNNMADFCIVNDIKIGSLRAVVMAGCSVSAKLHRKLLCKILNKRSQTYVPYGSTEALPITTFSGQEVLTQTELLTNKGKGTCLGKISNSQFSIKIIVISDEIIKKWQDDILLPVKKIGEICVKGPTVTEHYFNDLEADTKSKIYEKVNNQIYTWHRMGDIGYFDGEGRLWFCGRKKDIIIINNRKLFTDQCENIFNLVDGVKRSALIKSKSQQAILLVELESNVSQQKVRNTILAKAHMYNLTKMIRRVEFYKKFPVDVRHNAKIKRNILTQWFDNNY